MLYVITTYCSAACLLWCLWKARVFVPVWWCQSVNVCEARTENHTHTNRGIHTHRTLASCKCSSWPSRCSSRATNKLWCLLVMMPAGNGTKLNVTVHNSSVDNLLPNFKTGRVRWSGSWHCYNSIMLQNSFDWMYLPHQKWRKRTNVWKDGSLKPLAQSGLQAGPWQLFTRNPVADSRLRSHLVEFGGWIVCNAPPTHPSFTLLTASSVCGAQNKSYIQTNGTF